MNNVKKKKANDRVGKTRDLFKKIRDTISCKDGNKKGQKWQGHNRSRRDLKRCKNTQKNYTKYALVT